MSIAAVNSGTDESYRNSFLVVVLKTRDGPVYPVGEGRLVTAEIGSTPDANDAAVIEPGSTFEAVKTWVVHCVPVQTKIVLSVVLITNSPV